MKSLKSKKHKRIISTIIISIMLITLSVLCTPILATNYEKVNELIVGEQNVDDLTEEGKEYARNALNSLDEILESLVPNYKERFKEWFLDTTADGLDALSDLRDEGLELWDEIQSRRNSR